MAIFNLFFEYSETYSELDSEEATHCDHCHLICCAYIKGHVKMVNTKDALDAMFVDTVDTGVCGFLHNTLYRVMRCENCTLLCIKWHLTPAKREGYLKSLLSCRFSCSPV